MKVKDIMISSVITVESRKSLAQALELMIEHNIRRLPVMAGGKLVGMIVQHDIEKALRAPEILPETPVDWVMTRPPMTTSPEADLSEAINLLIEKKISGLPVLKEQELVGIISETDVLRLCNQLLTRLQA